MEFSVMCAVLAFLGNAVMLVMLTYKILTFSELEVDHVNPTDYCKKVNRLAVPEIVTHGFVMLILLVSGHFWLLLLNIPLMAYSIHMMMQGQHVTKPERVFVPSNKKYEQKKILGTLGFCLLFFFFGPVKTCIVTGRVIF